MDNTLLNRIKNARESISESLQQEKEKRRLFNQSQLAFYRRQLDFWSNPENPFPNPDKLKDPTKALKVGDFKDDFVNEKISLAEKEIEKLLKSIDDAPSLD